MEPNIEPNTESNMRKARKRKGYTLEQVAQKTSLTRAAVSMQETGKREASSGVLLRLSKLYNVTIDYLLGNDTSLVPTNNGTVSPEDAKDIWFATLATDDQETINLYLMLDYADRLRVNGYILSKLSKATA